MRIVTLSGAAKLLSRDANVNQKNTARKSSGIKVRSTGDGSAAVTVPPGAPKFLPPAGQEVTFHMEPDAVRTTALPDADPAAPVPFVVELVRPARPDGKSGVEWVYTSDPGLIDYELGRDVVLAWLVSGEPYKISLDGRLLLSHDGDGWKGHRRCTLTICATASQEMLAMMSVVSAVYDSSHKPFLSIIIAPGSLTEVLLDGVNVSEKGGCK